jgi:hypothetical protein
VPVLAPAKLTVRRLPEHGREHANLLTILQAAERARDLVQQVVPLSRKDAPGREPVDLALLRVCLKLSIASLPATIHGGPIDVTGAPCAGMQFDIVLPALGPGAEASPARRPKPASSPGP